MKIACVGGGPAGLYFAILMKARDPAHDITVLERNPRGVTYGWGVAFWDDLLEQLQQSDPATASEIGASSFRWNGQLLGGATLTTTSHAGNQSAPGVALSKIDDGRRPSLRIAP